MTAIQEALSPVMASLAKVNARIDALDQNVVSYSSSFFLNSDLSIVCNPRGSRRLCSNFISRVIALGKEYL